MARPGPASINPETGTHWGPSFPVLRMSDIVDSQIKLLDHLGVPRLHAVVGASIGGFLSLLIATRYPERVQIVLPVGTGIETTIYQRIINFEQVNAIEADPNFRGGDYYGGAAARLGLALARRIAHKTFVSLDALRERARPTIVSQRPPYGWYEMNHAVESYMFHQGEKFVRRFDANTYLTSLTHGNGLTSWPRPAPGISRTCSSAAGTRSFLFSVSIPISRFPPKEQAKLVQMLKRSRVPVMWITVHSDKGHDAFLLEPRLFTPDIQHLLDHHDEES